MQSEVMPYYVYQDSALQIFSAGLAVGLGASVALFLGTRAFAIACAACACGVAYNAFGKTIDGGN